MATGGVPLGRGPPGQQQSPGGLRGRGVPPPPPPPPPAPAPVPHAAAASSATNYPLQWTPLHTDQRQQEEAVHPTVHPAIQEAAAIKEQVVIKVKVVIHPQEEEPQDLLVQEEGHPLHQGGQQGGSTPPQQTGGAGFPGGTPQSPPGISQPNCHPDPWAPLDRSRKSLPKLMLPSNYRSCSILDMRQLLESWYDKSTFAIATWRGDAQRYWLTQVLHCAGTGVTSGFKHRVTERQSRASLHLR